MLRDNLWSVICQSIFNFSADDLDLESFGKKKKKKKTPLSMGELEDALPTDKPEVVP